MKILFIKLSSIGDVVHTLPVLSAVRKALPEAEISWAVEKSAAEILRGNPLIKNLIEIDTRSLRKEKSIGKIITSASEQWRHLREFDFDAAIDFQGLLKSAAVAFFSKAERRSGFDKAHLREPASRFLLTEMHRIEPNLHVIRKNLSLAEKTLKIFVSNDNLEFPVFTEKKHRNEAAEIVEKSGENFVILNPAGGWTTKLWAAEKFGSLADRIYQEFNFVSVVTTAPSERELAEKVLRKSRKNAVLTAEPSLKGFYELAKRAKLYIGGDTAPTHLAVAAKAPVVGIFGPTAWQRNGSVNSDDVCAERIDIGCRTDCNRRSCGDWVCMDIEVETVLQSVKNRLKKVKSSRLAVTI